MFLQGGQYILIMPARLICDLDLNISVDAISQTYFNLKCDNIFFFLFWFDYFKTRKYKYLIIFDVLILIVEYYVCFKKRYILSLYPLPLHSEFEIIFGEGG